MKSAKASIKKALRLVLFELKSMTRDRRLILITIIAPVAMTIWFAGTYSSNYLAALPVAVLDRDNSALSRKLVDYVRDSDRFSVAMYAGSEDELKQALSDRRALVGVYIQPGLAKSVSNREQGNVLLLSDSSNLIISNTAYAGFVPIVQTVSAGIGIKVIEAKTGLPASAAMNMELPFQIGDRTLFDPTITYINYLLPGFIAVFIQQFLLSALCLLIFRNPRELASVNTAGSLAAKFAAAVLPFIVSFSAAIVLVHLIFSVPFAGNPADAFVFAFIFGISLLGPALLIAAIAKSAAKFAQISFMLSMPAFLTAGYVWPESQMPLPLLIGVKLLWPLIHFARQFKEILIKGTPISEFGLDIFQMLAYAAICLPISIFVYKKVYNTDSTNVEKGDPIGQST